MQFLKTTVLALLIMSASAALRADPTWWSGDPKDAQKAAKQSNRWMVLYFETEKSESCLKMRDQTWPAMLPEDTDKNFIMLRLNPKDHQSFFQFYQVFQTPELVVTDGDSHERARLKGFVSAEILKVSLSNVFGQQEQKEKMVLLPDGRTMSPEDYAKLLADNRKAFEGKGFFWYESFDQYESFDKMGKRYNFQLQNASDLYATGGRFNSPGLYIGSDVKTYRQPRRNPSAVVHIDLSTGLENNRLDAVDLVEGRIEIRMKLKARLMPETLTECAQLVVMPKGVTSGSGGGKRYTTTLGKSDTSWTERIITSDVVRFKSVNPFLTLWLNEMGDGFYVDDISMRLLPPTGGDDIAMKEVDPLKALEGSGAEKLDPMFTGFDFDKDKRLKKSEVESQEGRLRALETMVIFMPFEQADTNRDGFIDYKEFRAAKEKTKKK